MLVFSKIFTPLCGHCEINSITNKCREAVPEISYGGRAENITFHRFEKAKAPLKTLAHPTRLQCIRHPVPGECSYPMRIELYGKAFTDSGKCRGSRLTVGLQLTVLILMVAMISIFVFMLKVLSDLQNCYLI